MKAFLIKILFSIAIVISIGIIIIYLSIRIYPEIFKGSNAEYLMWKYQTSIISKPENHKNIIIGDSRALAGINPLVLGDNFENLSLGGTTPIEGYYTLKKALQQKTIDTLIVSYGPYHYMYSDQFRSRTLAFNFINEEELNSIENVELKYGTAIDEYESGLANSMYRKSILRNYPLPYFQSTYISNLMTYFTSKHNPTIEMSSKRGHVLFGNNRESNGLAVETTYSMFKENIVQTSYLDSILTTAQKNNIYVVLITMPFNNNSYKMLVRKGFCKEYYEYLYRISNSYKFNGIQIEKNISTLPNNYFGDDAGHLNEKGSLFYSNNLRIKLNYL